MRIRADSAVLLAVACFACATDVGAQEPLGLRQLTDDPAQDGFSQWSPDGSRIAFKAWADPWVLDLPTGRLTEVFEEDGKLPIPTCRSPDGEEIFVLMRDAETQNSSIWAISRPDL
jgi:dipeptidyl aminopeptidase/acylaminoacyl peptidase